MAAAVTDSAARDRLSGILESELAHPSAWELGPDGSYLRRDGGETVPKEEPYCSLPHHSLLTASCSLSLLPAHRLPRSQGRVILSIPVFAGYGGIV